MFLGTLQTLIWAAVLLVVVAQLPALRTGSARVGLVVFLGSFAAAVLGLRFVLDRAPVLPPTEASSVVKYGLQELERATERNVLLIDGGSFANRGIDVEVMQAELAKLGYSARAVRLTLSGANHFERYRLQQDIKRRLSRDAHSGQHWLFLAEVHRAYDSEPLASFHRNLDTARTYHYLTPENAWHMAAAVGAAGEQRKLKDTWAWAVLRHTLINTFNVGVASRLSPLDEIEAARGTTGGRARNYSRFGGLGSQLENIEEPAEAGAGLESLTTKRESRERALWGPYLDDWIYFGLPSTQDSQLNHVRGFCAVPGRRCIAPDKPLLEALDRRKLWMDRGHLNPRGSEIFSRWLAGQLAERGYLKK